MFELPPTPGDTQSQSAVAALMLWNRPPDYAELFKLSVAVCSDLDGPSA